MAGLALIPGALLTWLLNYILNSAGILRGDSRFNRRMANGVLNHSVLHEAGDTPTEFLTKSLHFGGGEGLCAAEKEAWEFLTKSLHC